MAFALLMSGCIVRTWGSNLNGEIGNGQSSPITRPLAIGSGWSSVDLNDDHSCGVQVDQTLWCWGNNYGYELGLGGRESPRAPTQHPGTWVSVAGGWSHTCAVKGNGELWCAGSNGSGELGAGWFDTEGEGQELLTQSGTDSDWASVEAETYSTCGLKTDTTLWCWGGSDVGDGTTSDRSSPVHVGDGPGWATVAVGNSVSCGIKTGELWCWQAQTGTGSASLVPVRVGTESDWETISAFQANACGIRSGELWCWGDNVNGQIGDGTTDFRPTPVRIGGDTDWADVDSGFRHTCATKTSGSLWCWGLNAKSQLGLGDTADRSVPTQVGSSHSWATVDAGRDHTCAIETDTTLHCWGDDDRGQLGIGLLTATPGPIDDTVRWRQVAAGGSSYHGEHTCAVEFDRTLWCWGSNGAGQLGLGDDADRSVPTQVGSAGDWKQVSTGTGHTCGVRTTGTLWCWGDNSSQQTGFSVTTHDTPAQVGATTGWLSVSAGDSHTCGVKANGGVFCWGAWSLSGHGNDPPNKPWIPRRVGTMTGFTAVSAGLGHTCALQDGSLWCWGSDSYGQIGVASTVGWAAAPVKVGAPGIWTDVSVGDRHTCGAVTSGALWCWGANERGQLGLGTTSISEEVPQRVGSGNDWTEVALGSVFSCGLRGGGDLFCWGANGFGQLGDGTLTDRWAPTAAQSTDQFTSISAGESHTVGLAKAPPG